MIVIKFGRTSTGNPEGIARIIEILKDKDHQGNTQAAVISALTGVTETIIETARKAADAEAYIQRLDEVKKQHKDLAAKFLKGQERKTAVNGIEKIMSELSKIMDGVSLLGELSERSLDLVVSFGERLAASLFAAIFSANGIEAEFLDARSLIKTDSCHGRAKILQKETFGNIAAFFKGTKKPLQVVTGLIASDKDGHTTALGKDGSTLTAAVFAAALGAKKLEVWTKVDGILTANPKYVKDALVIKEISYVEAMEISHFGSGILFPPSIKAALDKGIPIFVRNTFNPSCEGTKIAKEVSRKAAGNFPIRGISSISNSALVRIQGSGMVGIAGFSARVFGSLARKSINIMLITQSPIIEKSTARLAFVIFIISPYKENRIFPAC